METILQLAAFLKHNLLFTQSFPQSSGDVLSCSNYFVLLARRALHNAQLCNTHPLLMIAWINIDVLSLHSFFFSSHSMQNAFSLRRIIMKSARALDTRGLKPLILCSRFHILSIRRMMGGGSWDGKLFLQRVCRKEKQNYYSHTHTHRIWDYRQNVVARTTKFAPFNIASSSTMSFRKGNFTKWLRNCLHRACPCTLTDVLPLPLFLVGGAFPDFHSSLMMRYFVVMPFF